MAAEAVTTTPVVPMNYLELNCPTTGEQCPSRELIARLCKPAFDPDNPPTPEQIDASEEDDKKKTAFLVAHNALINAYGCIAGPIENKCPPSVASNAQPAIRGLKRFLKNKLLDR